MLLKSIPQMYWSKFPKTILFFLVNFIPKRTKQQQLTNYQLNKNSKNLLNKILFQVRKRDSTRNTKDANLVVALEAQEYLHQKAF